MRVYLASVADPHINLANVHTKPLYALETFYSGKKACLQVLNCVGNENFLLDSGAFTFMNSRKNVKKEELNVYIDEYIKFINDYDIKYFFELDIDVIVGYEKVKEIRSYIEKKTCKKCIPVWHINRGVDDYIETCKNYSYIAIGGFVIKEIPKSKWDNIKKYVKVAHRYNTKVHGLGFTPLNLEEYNFDSVDSTSWKMHSIMGRKVCYFNGNRIVTNQINGIDKKVNIDAAIKYSFNEWIKYQYYMNTKKFKD